VDETDWHPNWRRLLKKHETATRKEMTMTTPAPADVQAQIAQLQLEAHDYRQRIVNIEAQNMRQQSEIDYLLSLSPAGQPRV